MQCMQTLMKIKFDRQSTQFHADGKKLLNYENVWYLIFEIIVFDILKFERKIWYFNGNFLPALKDALEAVGNFSLKT